MAHVPPKEQSGVQKRDVDHQDRQNEARFQLLEQALVDMVDALEDVVLDGHKRMRLTKIKADFMMRRHRPKPGK